MRDVEEYGKWWDGEPCLEIVDSAMSNYYEHDRDVIVVDRRLVENYPAPAVDHVVRHEFLHSIHDERDRWLRDFWHEIEEDLFMAFSKSDVAEELRRYRRERAGGFSVWVLVPNLIRGALSAFIRPAGWLYRRVVR
jgi:hypothetical protein